MNIRAVFIGNVNFSAAILKKLIGIDVKIDVKPAVTLRELVAKSKLNVFRKNWLADYPDGENYLALFYSKNFSPIGPNYCHFSNEEFDTIGGLVSHAFGYMPTRNEITEIEGFEFKVITADQRKIHSLRMKPLKS